MVRSSHCPYKDLLHGLGEREPLSGLSVSNFGQVKGVAVMRVCGVVRKKGVPPDPVFT